MCSCPLIPFSVSHSPSRRGRRDLLAGRRALTSSTSHPQAARPGEGVLHSTPLPPTIPVQVQRNAGSQPTRPIAAKRLPPDATWPGLCSGEASPRGCVTCRWRAGSAGTRIILIDGFLGNLPAACQAIPQQKSATVRSLYLRTCSSVGGSSSTRRKTLARLHQPSGHERGGVQLGERKDEEEGSNYSSWSGVPCRGASEMSRLDWIWMPLAHGGVPVTGGRTGCRFGAGDKRAPFWQSTVDY